MIDPLAAGLVRTLSRTLPHISTRNAARLADMGRLLPWLLPVRRRLVMEQLAASDLPLGAQQARRLWRAMVWHQWQNLLEFLRSPRLNRENLAETVTIRGAEHFDRALAAGRGALLVTAHFGNWELLGASLSLVGYPLHSMVRRQSGAFDKAINHLREASGNQVFDRVRSGRRILRVLKENGIVGILADQHTDNAGIPVSFLGRPCKASAAPVALALKSRAPLIPAFAIREGYERHRIEILPPIGLEETGNRERDTADGTRKYTRVIENYVRRYPAQWFWFHRRWRA